MEQFETQVIFSKGILRELRKHLKPPREKIRVAICSIGLMLLGIWLIVFRQSVPSGIFVVFIGLASPLSHHLNFYHVTKVNLRRSAENTGEKGAFELITSFAEDEIRICNKIGGMAYIKYDAVRRFAETKQWYALFTKENQVIIVDKMRLVQEEKEEAFLNFIKEKCKNIRWRNKRQ